MKVTIDIDCTPEEARAFFGLPDVRPLHGLVIDHLLDRTRAGLQRMEPEAIMKMWLQPGFAGMDQMMRSFGAKTEASGAKDSA